MDRLLRGRMIAACSLLLTVSGGSSVVADLPSGSPVKKDRLRIPMGSEAV
jgi:hypothetical protein